MWSGFKVRHDINGPKKNRDIILRGKHKVFVRLFLYTTFGYGSYFIPELKFHGCFIAVEGEQRFRMGSTSALYSGDLGFKSQAGNWLLLLKLLSFYVLLQVRSGTAL